MILPIIILILAVSLFLCHLVLDTETKLRKMGEAQNLELEASLNLSTFISRLRIVEIEDDLFSEPSIVKSIEANVKQLVKDGTLCGNQTYNYELYTITTYRPGLDRYNSRVKTLSADLIFYEDPRVFVTATKSKSKRSDKLIYRSCHIAISPWFNEDQQRRELFVRFDPLAVEHMVLQYGSSRDVVELIESIKREHKDGWDLVLLERNMRTGDWTGIFRHPLKHHKGNLADEFANCHVGPWDL